MSQISSPDITGRKAGASIIQDQDRMRNSATAEATIAIGKIGWWSAVLASICAASYGIAAIIVLVYSLSIQSSSQAQGWTGIEAFLAAFTPTQLLPVFPSLLLVPAFTALMVSIHSHASEEKRIWSRLGLAFTLIYATMAAMNYMIQLLPVWRSINSGETDGLAMFVGGNPHSIFWALAYAYIFMNLAMLLSAPVFDGNSLEKRIRVLFILNGASGLFTLGSAFLDSPQIYLFGSVVFWCPVFIAATISVASLFKRTLGEVERL